jgi:hypothetical protein
MGKGSQQVKETAYEKALAEVALQELGYYKHDIIPFRNRWIGDVTRNTAPLENRIAGQVNADLAQQRVLALPVGVDPSSGAAMSFNPALVEGAIGAKAAVGATQAVRDSKATGLQAAIDVMRGENTDAQTGLQGLAADSVNQAIGDARNRADTSATMGSSLASAVGGGIALYANRNHKKTKSGGEPTN